MLQHLNPDRETISRALNDLPETLDETYERIFCQIPNNAREFVHGTMKFIYTHTVFRNYHCAPGDRSHDTPILFLLDLIRRAISLGGNRQTGYLYAEDTVRELCGRSKSMKSWRPRPRHLRITPSGSSWNLKGSKLGLLPFLRLTERWRPFSIRSWSSPRRLISSPFKPLSKSSTKSSTRKTTNTGEVYMTFSVSIVSPHPCYA